MLEKFGAPVLLVNLEIRKLLRDPAVVVDQGAEHGIRAAPRHEFSVVGPPFTRQGKRLRPVRLSKLSKLFAQDALHDLMSDRVNKRMLFDRNSFARMDVEPVFRL